MVSHNAHSAHDLELLSAYLDGELSDRERTTLEQRLAHESTLQQTLDDLRATVALVRDLPRLKAPRSFTLDPAVYGRAIPWWRRLFTLELTLQLAGAVGTVASVLLIALALVAGSSGTDNAGSNVANEVQDSSAAESIALNATEDTLSLRRTATADASAWAAQTAIAYDGEGLLQTTIEAQTFHYATLESLELTVTAEAFRMTATVPMVGATQLPAAGFMEGGEAGNADSLEEADDGYADAVTLDSASDAEFEGSGAVAETAAEAPMPALAESDAGDADAFGAMPPVQAAPGSATSGSGGPPPAADSAPQPQATAGVTMLPTPTATLTRTPAAAQIGQAENAAGMAQSNGADNAASASEPCSAGDAPDDGQAQRERDDEDNADDNTTASDAEAPCDIMADETGTDMALDRTATAQATPTESAEVAFAATEQAQAVAAAPPAEPQNAATAEKRAAADEDAASSWLIGLGVALFVVSVVVFVLGRRRASRV